MNDKFNKAAKGALVGVGVAAGAAIVLPIVTISAPVLIVGAAIGGWLGYKK